jgi:pre-mRNA-splicing helicase BRR2
MGSRVQREVPKDLEKKKKKAITQEGAEQARKRKAGETTGYGYADIIEATQDVEGLKYRPRTTETREVYELILSSVHQALGDQAQDIVRSAADTVLETLKEDSLKDFDKKKDIESVIGPISGENFAQLITLSKKITDYGGDDEAQVDPDIERKDAEIDDEVGVAVVFGDEDEQEEEEEEGYEIREDSDEEGEEEGAREDNEGGALEEEDNGALMFGGEPSTSRKAKAKDDDRVSPHEIDGFWLQRLVSTVYPDAVTATDKTTTALSLLSAESNLRECENALMDLFEWDHYEVVRVLIKNRDVIVWCTKLARSDEDERINVEVAMREKGVGWILKELAGDRSKPAAHPSTADPDAMEVDVKAVQKGSMLDQSLAPRQTVDLEGMAFSQGGRLMSNKKCKLPDGSFKRSKKGYEEIHVPAPKKKDPVAGELVPIESLPPWLREAFKGTKNLNRVQSRLYPVAFGTDDPILLCAPTGAGKVSHIS